MLFFRRRRRRRKKDETRRKALFIRGCVRVSLSLSLSLEKDLLRVEEKSNEGS